MLRKHRLWSISFVGLHPTPWEETVGCQNVTNAEVTKAFLPKPCKRRAPKLKFHGFMVKSALLDMTFPFLLKSFTGVIFKYNAGLGNCICLQLCAFPKSAKMF